MRLRSILASILALLAVLLWSLPSTSYAGGIGTPYRGPIEWLGSGGSGADTETEDAVGGTEEGGGEEDPGGPPTDPGGGGGTPPQGGAGKTAKIDGPILWQWWWEHNKDRFLAGATERGRINMGSAYYWFGAYAKYPPRDIVPVSEKLRKEAFFTSLRGIVRNERNADVRAVACIALGRLGDVAAPAKAKGAKKDDKDKQSSNLVARELIRVIGKEQVKDVKIHAVLALGVCADEAGCEFLMRSYKTFNADERAYVNIAFGLARYTPAIPLLLDHMPRSVRSKAQDEQVAALHALGLMGRAAVPELNKEDRDGVARIEKLATSGNDEIVMNAVAALGRLEQGRARVVKMAGNKSKNVKWTALLTLANYWTDEKDAKAAFAALKGKSGFKSGDGQDKSFAVLGMCELARNLDPNSKVRADIVKFVKKEALETKKNNYVRACAAVGLGVAKDRTAVHGIAKLLTDTTAQDHVIAAACVGLGLLRATQHAEKMKNEVMLKSKWNDDARGYAALGIALMGDTTRIDDLKAFAAKGSLNDKTRRQMPLALGILGDKSMVARLANYFSRQWKKNQRYEVSNAAFALSWIKDQSSADKLARMTRSGKPEVRGMAIIAMGYSGARDRVSPLTRCFANMSFRNRFGQWGVLHAISLIL